MIWFLGYGNFDAFMRSAIKANGGGAPSHHHQFNGAAETRNGNEHIMFSEHTRRDSSDLVPPPANLDLYPELGLPAARHRTPPGFRRESESPEGAAAVQTYARVVRTTARAAEEEDTLTKIRNLGTYGFQNLG